MIKEYSSPTELISPTNSDAFGELPMAGVVTRLIIAATTHADLLGLGYNDLGADGNAWVLSRISVEMERMPRIFEKIVVTTWVEDYGRMVSNRNFAITLDDGTPLGYARSVWACINVATRRPADVGHPLQVNLDRYCPIAPVPRLRAVTGPERIVPVKFTFSDIDLNGHVNSARYVEHIINLFDYGFHSAHSIGRFDIAYMHEAHLDTGAQALIATGGTLIDLSDGKNALCRAAIQWKKRK